LHEAALAIGKQFGYKFKPWEAAKITKNIGNAAKMIGPLMSIVGLAMDVKETADEIEQDEKIRKQRLETRQVFVNIASDLETKYSEELSRMFNVYDEISNQISNDRDKVQQLVKSSSVMSERLYGYKKDLIAIQGDIF
jgi:adenylosuccinate synthase